MIIKAPLGLWIYGTRLQKIHGALWRGRVVGYYSTEQTAIGYVIESSFEPGSVRVYPAHALKPWDKLEETQGLGDIRK